jgi:hypothetical protein
MLLGVLCEAGTILNPVVLKLLVLGILALLISGIGGILGGYAMYYWSGKKYNPVIGIAGVSCVPTTAPRWRRNRWDRAFIILPHALGANISGVITSAIFAATLIAFLLPRSAMPATVRLADAPIKVPLPPRHAPSDSAHHNGNRPSVPPKVGAIALISGNHGRYERNVVDDRRQHRRRPQHADPGDPQVAAGHFHQFVGQQAQEAGVLDAGDHDEQADEEEDGDPLHLVEHLGDVLRLVLGRLADVVQQHQQGGASHADRARLQADEARRDERADDEREHGHRLLQQAVIGDRLLLVERHHLRPRLRRRRHPSAPDQVHGDYVNGKDDRYHRAEVDDECVEREPNLRADEDVRRIADQRRRAADVRGQDLREQIGIGVDLQAAR